MDDFESKLMHSEVLWPRLRQSPADAKSVAPRCCASNESWDYASSSWKYCVVDDGKPRNDSSCPCRGDMCVCGRGGQVPMERSECRGKNSKWKHHQIQSDDACARGKHRWPCFWIHLSPVASPHSVLFIPSLVDQRCLIFDAGRILKSSNFYHPIWVCLPGPPTADPSQLLHDAMYPPRAAMGEQAACRIKWKSNRKGQTISARGSDKVSLLPPREAIGAAGCRDSVVASSFVLDLKRCKSRMC